MKRLLLLFATTLAISGCATSPSGQVTMTPEGANLVAAGAAIAITGAAVGALNRYQYNHPPTYYYRPAPTPYYYYRPAPVPYYQAPPPPRPSYYRYR
jgi:hypothetical protein